MPRSGFEVKLVLPMMPMRSTPPQAMLNPIKVMRRRPTRSTRTESSMAASRTAHCEITVIWKGLLNPAIWKKYVW